MPNENTHPVKLSVTFQKTTVKQIRKLSLTTNKSVHDTILFLANTAIKYNYTEDYRYIPCKPQNDDIPSKEQSYVISVLISASFDKRLSALMKVNFTDNKAGTFRSLVETALLYDYNKNLFFHAPIRLSTTLPSGVANKQKDIIALDII